MGLTSIAAQVMRRAQNDDPDAAVALAEEALAAGRDHGPAELAGLWYAVAVAEHIRGDMARQVAAAERCLEHGRAAEEPGWVSNALSMRAMAHVRTSTIEAALLDLARAEVALSACVDEGLRSWAHTGLGYCYVELRLYELGVPHFEAALAATADPLPLPESRAIDLMNLAEVHLRWADELERACPYDGSDEDAERHRAEGQVFAREAVVEAGRAGAGSLLAACRALDLCSRPREAAATTLPELQAAVATPAHPGPADHQGAQATVRAALARTLWRLGRREEALEQAARAAAASSSAVDWHVGATVQWLLVEMQAEHGLSGALAGRDYARLLSRVLWQQRLSTLQGAKAALEVERLEHDKQAAQRAAVEDPLTGIGNRRALDQVLRAGATAPGDRSTDQATLLVVDLDDFKSINDTYGHPVGDAVLRAVAGCVRRAARAEDLVARLGGDEFVVLAHGLDAEAGEHLADRVSEAIAELAVATPAGPLRLRASVGVATGTTGVDLEELLAEADAAMYDVKSQHRVRPAVDAS